MKVKDVIRKLERINPEKEILSSLWHEEDVQSRTDYALTRGQIAEIFDHLERTHNAEIGINWDAIDQAIEEVIKH